LKIQIFDKLDVERTIRLVPLPRSSRVLIQTWS